MYKLLFIVVIIIIIVYIYRHEYFINNSNNNIKKPNIDKIVINDVVLDNNNFINNKIIDDNNLLITNPNINNVNKINKINQEEDNNINLSNIMIPYNNFDAYFNEYNISKNKVIVESEELYTNIGSGLTNFDIKNIYRRYIKRGPSYLNDPDMRSYNTDESRRYSGLMDIGMLKLE